MAMAEPDKVDAWLASDNTLPPAAPAPAPAPAAVELAGYPAPPAAGGYTPLLRSDRAVCHSRIGVFTPFCVSHF